MKFALSAITVGAVLALSSHVALAQSTVTVTQQGNTNIAYAEQIGASSTVPTDPTNVIATITQIGDNNRVGTPSSGYRGIYQNSNQAGASALVFQQGRSNTASVVQDGTSATRGEVDARVTQLGNSNQAVVGQEIVTSSIFSLDQNGTGNIANMFQVNSADTRLQGTQNGDSNRISVTQLGVALGGLDITQNGDGNRVSTTAINVLGGGPSITQTGDLNTATTSQNGESGLLIVQDGIGNRADVTQIGEGHSADVNQYGNNNLATVNQDNPPGTFTGNRTLINQRGDSNTAIVRQSGQGYVANVSHIGSGNYTNIYQH